MRNARWREILPTLGLVGAALITLEVPGQAQDLPSAEAVQPESFVPITPPLGPLTLRTRSPLQMFRLGFTPLFQAPPAGTFAVTQTFTWTNVWGVDFTNGRFLLDGEFMRLGTYLSYGVTESVQVGLEAGGMFRSGGFADRWIEQFHRAVGAGNQGREFFPRNELHFFFVQPDGSTFDVRGTRKFFSEDIYPYLQTTLLDEGRDFVTAAVQGQLKIPTRGTRDVLRGGDFDAGESLLIAKSIGDFVLYLAGSYAVYAPATFGGMRLRDSGWSAFAAVEWRVSGSVSIVHQWLVTSGAAVDLGELSRPSTEIAFGVKVRLSGHAVFEAGVIENLFLYDNSPDIGVHFGLRWEP